MEDQVSGVNGFKRTSRTDKDLEMLRTQLREIEEDELRLETLIKKEKKRHRFELEKKKLEALAACEYAGDSDSYDKDEEKQKLEKREELYDDQALALSKKRYKKNLRSIVYYKKDSLHLLNN